MVSEKISLKHKDPLKSIFKRTAVGISEFSFANIYLFRQVHDYHLVNCEGGQCLIGKTWDGASHVMPLSSDVGKINARALLSFARDKQAFIFPLPQEWLDAFKEYDVEVNFNDSDSDYVVSVEKLRTYQGRSLHGQKNLLGNFARRYHSVSHGLSEKRLQDAFIVLEAWQQETDLQKKDTDYWPCKEAIRLGDELGICGVLYYIDREPVGFLIGEELNKNMFALHFAKAKKQYKGVYQFMYNHLALHLAKNYEWVNFAQDLGKPALRRAKSSYAPDFKLKKYRVSVA